MDQTQVLRPPEEATYGTETATVAVKPPPDSMEIQVKAQAELFKLREIEKKAAYEKEKAERVARQQQMAEEARKMEEALKLKRATQQKQKPAPRCSCCC